MKTLRFANEIKAKATALANSFNSPSIKEAIPGHDWEDGLINDLQTVTTKYGREFIKNNFGRSGEYRIEVQCPKCSYIYTLIMHMSMKGESSWTMRIPPKGRLDGVDRNHPNHLWGGLGPPQSCAEIQEAIMDAMLE